jgi:hypothetical protein
VVAKTMIRATTWRTSAQSIGPFIYLELP